MDQIAILPEDVIATTSGLDQLLGIVDGRYGAPAMAETLGFRLVAAEAGRAVFEGTPDEGTLNPIGLVHGGWAASILDSALGCAVHTTLAPGERYVTLELKVNFIRAMRAGDGPVSATGTLISRGRRTAVAEARLTDAAGTILAAGTATCYIS